MDCNEEEDIMAYQIKVSLMYIKPAIWRRLSVPGKITFSQLHQIIQAAFGWLDYHLYKFKVGNTLITIPYDLYAPIDLYGEEVKDLDS
ncbi:MAG: plasmid pRiA4b ORF-3 family protein [Actinomycetota bacterium]